MVTIYCIEDINDLKYVGSTKQKLKTRLKRHLYCKRTTKDCSSSKLDLDNCKIYSLETCNESQRKERESYWINHIDCVNEIKLNRDRKIINQDNREKRSDYKLFRSKKVANGCYEFVKMLEEY